MARMRTLVAACCLVAPCSAWADQAYPTYNSAGLYEPTKSVAGALLECATQPQTLNGSTVRVAVPCGTTENPLSVVVVSGGGSGSSATDAAAVPMTASATGQIGSTIDTTGYNSVVYSFTTIPTGAAIQFQDSPDGTNWNPVTAFSGPTGAVSISATATTPGTYIVRSNARYQRLVVTTYTSGTISVVSQRRIVPTGNPGVIDSATEAALGTTADTLATNGTGSWSAIALLKWAGSSLNIISTTLSGTLNVKAVSGTANIGRTSLPTATGSSLGVTATSATANTASTLFPSGTITNGCAVQNNGGSPIVVDYGGGSPSTPVFPMTVASGGGATQCPFVPSTAVTVWSPTGTSIPLGGGKF